MASVRGVVNTLLQTAKFGTPLAQSLRILAAEFRDARLVRAEEKAARLPAMLTVPMILFILPTLFIVLLGPAALSIIDTFSKGRATSTSTAGSTSTGASSSNSRLKRNGRAVNPTAGFGRGVRSGRRGPSAADAGERLLSVRGYRLGRRPRAKGQDRALTRFR